MYALNLAEDGRILSATFHQFAPASAVTVAALPEGNIYEYRYKGGKYIHDPLPVPEEPAEPEPSEDDSAIWDELDAAYQEGVDSV